MGMGICVDGVLEKIKRRKKRMIKKYWNGRRWCNMVNSVDLKKDIVVDSNELYALIEVLKSLGVTITYSHRSNEDGEWKRNIVVGIKGNVMYGNGGFESVDYDIFANVLKNVEIMEIKEGRMNKCRLIVIPSFEETLDWLLKVLVEEDLGVKLYTFNMMLRTLGISTLCCEFDNECKERFIFIGIGGNKFGLTKQDCEVLMMCCGKVEFEYDGIRYVIGVIPSLSKILEYLKVILGLE